MRRASFYGGRDVAAGNSLNPKRKTSVIFKMLHAHDFLLIPYSPTDLLNSLSCSFFHSYPTRIYHVIFIGTNILHILLLTNSQNLQCNYYNKLFSFSHF